MYIKETPQGYQLSLYVQPRARKSEICGIWNACLKIKVRSAPAENKANQEVRETLSKYFGIPLSEIQIIQGNKSRNKIILLETTDESIKKSLYSWER